MRILKNFNNYNDIIILEKYIDNKITEKEFSNHFDILNEKAPMSNIVEKIKNMFDWVIDNIKKVGIKIGSITKNILKIAKNILSVKSLRVVTMICIILLTQVSFGNVNGDGEKDKNKTVLVITSRQINESKILLNTAIGFLSMTSDEGIYEKDNTQALGVLISIRDNLSPNNLNADAYRNMSKKSKDLIEFLLKILKKDIANAIQNNDNDKIGTFVAWKEIGEKLSAHVDLSSRGFKYVKVVDKDGNIIVQWSSSFSVTLF